MEQSWLVQRLEKPRSAGQMAGLLNSLSFGGGLRNGGLSPEAMGLLSSLMSFDYMGAAEFEFGALPAALRRIADADLAAFTINIPLVQVPANWRLPKGVPAPDGDATVYILCAKSDGPEVIDRISAWARGGERLKETTRLPSALRPHDEWDHRVVGWLELDNGFFFATDREMWEGVCRLFGVDIAAEASA